MESNNGLAVAASQHLELLRRDREKQDALDLYYVQKAFMYGVPVSDIAEQSGIPLEQVRGMLGGG